jgi:hypothetical protein
VFIGKYKYGLPRRILLFFANEAKDLLSSEDKRTHIGHCFGLLPSPGNRLVTEVEERDELILRRGLLHGRVSISGFPVGIDPGILGGIGASGPTVLAVIFSKEYIIL